jgi:hypothetical protein
MAGCLDQHLESASEECVWPWDLNAVPEFRGILGRLDAEMQNKQLARNRELREQVQSATFTQMNEELALDVHKLNTYYNKLNEVRTHWGDKVICYKRNRHAKGLSKVRTMMTERLLMMTIVASNAPMEFSTFKKNLGDKYSSLKETCP